MINTGKNLARWLVHHSPGSPNAGPEKEFIRSPRSDPVESTAYFPQIAFSGGYFLVTGREAPPSYPSAISQTLRPLLGKHSGPLLPASAPQFSLVPLPTVAFAELPSSSGPGALLYCL